MVSHPSTSQDTPHVRNHQSYLPLVFIPTQTSSSSPEALLVANYKSFNKHASPLRVKTHLSSSKLHTTSKTPPALVLKMVPTQRKFFVIGNWKMNVDKSRIDSIVKFMTAASLDPTTGKLRNIGAKSDSLTVSLLLIFICI